ncbi:MAG TPA: carbohydrate kinase family protein [Casimicrobiaceae bacterium]|nr:carbohydrate kinase family protein [Casimicrobiaceae bacterium]
MRTLICGSLAYDTITVFPDRFGKHILPDRTHMISVSFVVGDMRREWGGCAGNIAYNLKALGGEPVVMATLGEDGAAYRERLQSLGIGIEGVKTLGDTFTAQAFIITDLDDNQITAFHPGAMVRSHELRVEQVADVKLGIVAPDGRDGMLAHAAQFREHGVPYIFDPGQGLPLFSGDELASMIEGALAVTVNDYEASLLCERTRLSESDIARRVEALIVTLGGEGSRIHTGGSTITIPAVPAPTLVDPTGCGDAYRAGLLYGVAQGWIWEKSGRLATLLGSIKIGSRGGQNHAIDRETVAAAYRKVFGSTLW